MSFTLEVTKNGKDAIIFNKHKYRECYSVKNGDLVWRCLGKNCKASIRTNKDKTGIFSANESHTGPHPVTMRTLTPTRQQLKSSLQSPTPTGVVDSPLIAPDEPASTPVSTHMTAPTQGEKQVTVLSTSDNTGESEDNLSLKKAEAQNSELKEQLMEMTERFRCVMDHTIENDTRLLQYTNEIFSSNTSRCMTPDNEPTTSAECATQCDLDTYLLPESPAPQITAELQGEIYFLKKENECLTRKISEHVKATYKAETENNYLKNKTQELTNELNILKSGGNRTGQDFRRLYPNDSLTCLTKRLETELYCKNVEIKALSESNAELRKEISTLNTITEMLQAEMEGLGNHTNHTVASYTCSGSSPAFNSNQQSSLKPQPNTGILVYPDVHCTMNGTPILHQRNQISEKNQNPRIVRDSDGDGFRFPKLFSRLKHVTQNKFKLGTENSYLLLQDVQLDSSVTQEGNTIITEKYPKHCTQRNNVAKQNPSSYSKQAIKPQRRIVVLADSHGRNMSWHMSCRTLSEYNTVVFAKPGAKMKTIIEEGKHLLEDMSQNDYLVLLAGTNDMNNGEPGQLTVNQGINKLLSSNKKTNIIINSIPYRYDTPRANDNIEFVNLNIEKKIKVYKGKLQLIYNDINSILKRSHYTAHGLHLNKRGKRLLGKLIVETINQIHNSYDLNTDQQSVINNQQQLMTTTQVGPSPCNQTSEVVRDTPPDIDCKCDRTSNETSATTAYDDSNLYLETLSTPGIPPTAPALRRRTSQDCRSPIPHFDSVREFPPLTSKTTVVNNEHNYVYDTNNTVDQVNPVNILNNTNIDNCFHSNNMHNDVFLETNVVCK